MLEKNKQTGRNREMEKVNKNAKLAGQVPDLVSGVDINNNRKQQVGFRIF